MIMKPAILLVLVLLAATVLVVPAVSAATVEYPAEYYTLNSESLAFENKSYDLASYWSIVSMARAQLSEIRRQSILLEKQNELLAEQNQILERIANNTHNDRESIVYYGYGIGSGTGSNISFPQWCETHDCQGYPV